MNTHHCVFDTCIRKKTKVSRTDTRTDGQTDGRTDNVKTVYPTTNKVCGGIIRRNGWHKRTVPLQKWKYKAFFWTFAYKYLQFCQQFVFNLFLQTLEVIDALHVNGRASRIRVVSPTFPFAPESFRPLSLSPPVVSPPGRFAHFPFRPWVVSPTSPFAPESFRPHIKFYF